MISDLPFSTLHDLLEVAFPVHTFPAKYEYLNVLDQNADCRDTIADVLSGLHKEFNIGESKRHLVVLVMLKHTSIFSLLNLIMEKNSHG